MAVGRIYNDQTSLQPPMRESWKDDALCAEIGPDIFFMGKGGSRYVEAKSVCKSCTVTPECLENIMAIEKDLPDDRFGFQGGLSPRQRAHLQKRIDEMKK